MRQRYHVFKRYGRGPSSFAFTNIENRSYFFKTRRRSADEISEVTERADVQGLRERCKESRRLGSRGTLPQCRPLLQVVGALEHTISVRPQRGMYQRLYRLQIGSKEMCDDLRKLGFSERKLET